LITVVAPIAQTHIIFTGNEDYTFDPFTLSGGHCPTPTYTAVEQGQAVLPPSWLTFDDATRTFSADSNDNADAGTYTIEITAEYADGTTVSDLFDYTLTDCTMTPVAITNVNYNIYSGASTFTVTAFTLSDALCTAPTYSAVE